MTCWPRLAGHSTIPLLFLSVILLRRQAVPFREDSGLAGRSSQNPA